MNRTCSPIRHCLAFVAMALLGISGKPAAMAATSPVSQAWATRITGPSNAAIEPGAMTLGPDGDVYHAGRITVPGSSDILLTRHSPSGDLIWERRYEASQWDYPTAMEARGTNIYVGGTAQDITGTSFVLTLKYRDDGTFEWARRFDGPRYAYESVRAIAVDASGNVLVAGDSMGMNGTLDFMVLKYGPTGDLLWSYDYDGPGHTWDRVVDMHLDAAGHVHLAGNSVNSGGSYLYSVVTLKLNPDGQALWIRPETSTDVWGTTAQSLAVDAEGNVATAGFERTYAVLWKYRADGTRQWISRYRTEESASVQSSQVRFDAQGNALLAVNLYGPGNDGGLVKYAPDGQQLWTTRLSDPQRGLTHVQAMDIDAAGNTYITTSPTNDFVVVKVGPDGSQLWSTTYNSEYLAYDYSRFLRVAPSGDVIVSGRSSYGNAVFMSLVKYTQQFVAGLPLAIVTPTLQIVDPGADVVFTATATGEGQVQFQWRKNGRPLPDATNATLALAAVQVADRGDYSVIVGNSVGTTISSQARLSVRTPPEVIVSPANTLAYPGTMVSFKATVAGNEFVELQWRHNGTNIPAATNEILQLANLSITAGGLYDIVATTVGGSTTSSAAGLKISREVELMSTTRERSAFTGWPSAPRLLVRPNGDTFVLIRTNEPAQGPTVLLRKHNAGGSLLWSSSLQGAGISNASPIDLAADSFGHVHLIGLSGEHLSSAALITAKFSPDGQQLWLREHPMTNRLGVFHAALAVAADGRSTIGTLGERGVSIVRYSNEGELLWSINDFSPANDTVAVAVDASGNSYIGTTVRVEDDNEVRLRKIDANGNTVWTKPYASGRYNRLGSIAVDPSDHLIAAGTGEADHAPDGRMFVLKYTPDGERLWETRTGGSWPDLSYVAGLAAGPDGAITILAASDDDASQEHSRLIRLTAGGEVRYLAIEWEIIVNNPSQLAVDRFGNAYVTGYGGHPVTGADAVTAKYNADGQRPWLVRHAIAPLNWESGLSVGVDDSGDVRVLASLASHSDSSVELEVLHYRQRDPAGTFRLQLIPGPGGAFHLSTPATESFRIESSFNLQDWTTLTADETQRLLQPNGTPFSVSPQRFFRLILVE